MPKIKQAEFRLEPRFYGGHFINRTKTVLEKISYWHKSSRYYVGGPLSSRIGTFNSNPANTTGNMVSGPNTNPNVIGRQTAPTLVAPGTINTVGTGLNNQNGPTPAQAPITTLPFGSAVGMRLMNDSAQQRSDQEVFQFVSAPSPESSSQNVIVRPGRFVYRAPQFPLHDEDEIYQSALNQALVDEAPSLFENYISQFHPGFSLFTRNGELTSYGRIFRAVRDVIKDKRKANDEKVRYLISVAARTRGTPLGDFSLRMAMYIAGTMSEDEAVALAQTMLNNGMTREQVQEFLQTAHNWVNDIYSNAVRQAHNFNGSINTSIFNVMAQSLIPGFRGGIPDTLYKRTQGYVGANPQILNNLDLDLLSNAIGVRDLGIQNNENNKPAHKENNNINQKEPASDAPDTEWAWYRFNTVYRQTPSYMPFSYYHQQIHRGIGDILRNNNMPAHQKAWWLLTYGNMAYATRNPALAQFAYQTGMYFVGKLNDNEANQFKNMLKMQGFNDNQINMFLQQAKAFAALMDDRAERRGIEEQGWYATDHAYPLYYGVDWDWFNQFNRANNRNKGRR